MSTPRRDWPIVMAVVAIAGVVGVSSVVYGMYAFRGPLAGNSPGIPASGPSGMWGMMGRWSYLSSSQLDSIAATQPIAASNGTLTFGGGTVRILVLMGPMNEGQSMYSFVVDNFTNPTLVIPQGTRVTMVVVNLDTDAYHGLMLTRFAPPYGYNVMPLMMSSPASTAAIPPSSSGYPSQQISFTVSGEEYYVCPIPGHAQSGMFGLIRPG